MIQLFLLVLILITLFFTLYLSHYKASQNIKYQNDERWKYIQLKSNQITQKYYEFLMVAVAVLLIFNLFLPIQIHFNLARVLLIIFLCLALGNVVETIALKHLDRRN